MLDSTKEVLREAVQHAKFHKKQMIPNIWLCCFSEHILFCYFRVVCVNKYVFGTWIHIPTLIDIHGEKIA